MPSVAQKRATPYKDITPTIVRRFMVSLQAKGLAAYTQHAYCRALRAWLNFCVTEELLTASPLAKVKAPKLPKLILPALTVEQAKKIIAPEHIVIRPPLTDEQHARMLTEVMEQTEAALS